MECLVIGRKQFHAPQRINHGGVFWSDGDRRSVVMTAKDAVVPPRTIWICRKAVSSTHTRSGAPNTPATRNDKLCVSYSGCALDGPTLEIATEVSSKLQSCRPRASETADPTDWKTARVLSETEQCTGVRRTAAASGEGPK